MSAPYREAVKHPAENRSGGLKPKKKATEEKRTRAKKPKKELGPHGGAHMGPHWPQFFFHRWAPVLFLAFGQNLYQKSFLPGLAPL